MQRRSKPVLAMAGALMAAVLAAPGARADSIFPDNAAETGSISDYHGGAAGGVEVVGGQARMLVAVTFHGLPEDGKAGESRRLFWIEGSLSIDPKATDGNMIAAYRLRIVPYTHVFDSRNEPMTLGLLPFEFHKDTQSGVRRVSVSVVSIGFHGSMGAGFAQAALNLLGYSMIERLDTHEKTDSFKMADLNVALGAQFFLSGNRESADSVKVRWTVSDIKFTDESKYFAGELASQLELAFKSGGSDLAVYLRAGAGISSPFFGQPAPGAKSPDERPEASYLFYGIGVKGRF